jgi:hypothetical protein
MRQRPAMIKPMHTDPPSASPTPTIITATQMQHHSGQILKRVFTQHEYFVVERDGYPVAAIVPMDVYRAYFPTQDQLPRSQSPR